MVSPQRGHFFYHYNGENKMDTEMDDYDEIKKEIANKFEELCDPGREEVPITYIINPAVYFNKSNRQHKWEGYEARVTFTQGNITQAVPYKMGIGLFDQRDVKPYIASEDRHEIISTLNKNLTTKYFVASMIFANTCLEAKVAMDYAVEDYCADFFGNVDSHRGHLAHDESIRRYHIISQMIGCEKLQKFAELAGKL